ncbi:MAG TPA: 2Fe-2S iron-sulfur cluster-binding protein, partial [Methylomirabilota bacterium]|nr:2Fe-2S iron-sulfur cluster-binding protein [Methylomirabilota bacterium]
MKRAVRVKVNGTDCDESVDVRSTLADFLREDLDLTGTHVGCEHGVCGSCTVLFDGLPVRACLMLAAQAEGHEVTTIEGVAPPDEPLHPIQEAFAAKHGLQCGYCTPGI